MEIWMEIKKKNHTASCIPTCRALADKAADVVQTFTLVQAGGAHALIHLYLTMSPLESCAHDKKQVFIDFSQCF